MGERVWPAGSETRGTGATAIRVDLWTRDEEVPGSQKGEGFHATVEIRRLMFKSFRTYCGNCRRRGRTDIVPYDDPDPKLRDCRCGAKAIQNESD